VQQGQDALVSLREQEHLSTPARLPAGGHMRTIKSAGLSVLFVAISTVAALAHAKMNASVPKDGATVPAGLSEIELSFSKPLRLTLVHVVRAPEQKEVPVTSELPKSFVNSAKLTVGGGAAGPAEL